MTQVAASTPLFLLYSAHLTAFIINLEERDLRPIPGRLSARSEDEYRQGVRERELAAKADGKCQALSPESQWCEPRTNAELFTMLEPLPRTITVSPLHGHNTNTISLHVTKRGVDRPIKLASVRPKVDKITSPNMHSSSRLG